MTCWKMTFLTWVYSYNWLEAREVITETHSIENIGSKTLMSTGCKLIYRKKLTDIKGIIGENSNGSH